MADKEYDVICMDYTITITVISVLIIIIQILKRSLEMTGYRQKQLFLSLLSFAFAVKSILTIQFSIGV